MSTLEATVEELKSLPPSKLAEAAGYIHRLASSDGNGSRTALERAFGCLTPSEAGEMERAIATNCERIDAGQW
ncbi:MAG: hypothetical protein O2960_00685 [Verrucomicrobia bacterium]|nr:hypothetical protein [Verrucomicrobiota bacterium]